MGKLSRLFRDQRGHAELALLGLIVVVGLVAVVATITFTAQAPDSPSAPRPDAAAEQVLAQADQTAVRIAGANHGSYARVGLPLLRKDGPVPISSSNTNAWLSSATATATGYSLTATAGPTGDTFTITRDSSGRVSRTCSVAKPASSGCHNGSW